MQQKKGNDRPAVDRDDLVPIQLIVADSIVEASCAVCGTTYLVEPDAEDYDCYEGCGEKRTVTSPLVLQGLI